MSDLRPLGTPIILDGVERHLLFTLNAIDEIQAHYDSSTEEVIDTMIAADDDRKILRAVLMHLLNDEAERLECWGEGQGLKKYTEKEIGWLVSNDNLVDVLKAVIRAYGLSLPEPEDGAPNTMGGQQGQ